MLARDSAVSRAAGNTDLAPCDVRNGGVGPIHVHRHGRVVGADGNPESGVACLLRPETRLPAVGLDSPAHALRDPERRERGPRFTDEREVTGPGGTTRSMAWAMLATEAASKALQLTVSSCGLNPRSPAIPRMQTTASTPTVTAAATPWSVATDPGWPVVPPGRRFSSAPASGSGRGRAQTLPTPRSSRSGRTAARTGRAGRTGRVRSSRGSGDRHGDGTAGE